MKGNVQKKFYLDWEKTAHRESAKRKRKKHQPKGTLEQIAFDDEWEEQKIAIEY